MIPDDEGQRENKKRNDCPEMTNRGQGGHQDDPDARNTLMPSNTARSHTHTHINAYIHTHTRQ